MISVLVPRAKCELIAGCEGLDNMVVFIQIPSYCQAMQSNRKTLMDEYQYVMFGRIFKYEDAKKKSDSNQV